MKTTKATAAPATPTVEDFVFTPKDPACKLCQAQTNSDGSITAIVEIDPIIAKRIKTRLGHGADLSRWLWEECFHRALVNMVY